MGRRVRVGREGGRNAAPPVWVPPDEFVGLDRHGRAYSTMLAGAPEVCAKRVASGMDPEIAAGREQTCRLAGSIVHDTARELLTGLADPDSAISHPQVESWARVAGPKACDFCVMLAGRGYVYTSRDTAMMADSGKRYHDHCSCGVAIGPAGTRSPTAEQQYRAWVADGSRTQWGMGSQRTAAHPSTIPPAIPRMPAELHKMADDLEHFAATVETRLPDAAAKARARAAQLRADANDGSGASIPEPRRGGSRPGNGERPIVPRPRTSGSSSGAGKPPKPPRGLDADGEPLWPSGGEIPTEADLRAHGLIGVDWEHFKTPAKIRDGTAAKEIAIAEWIEATYQERVISVAADPRAHAKTPDALWARRLVEFKTLDEGTLNAMSQNLQDAGRKARHVIIDTQRTSLSRDEALALVARSGRYTGRLDSILLIDGRRKPVWAKGGPP